VKKLRIGLLKDALEEANCFSEHLSPGGVLQVALRVRDSATTSTPRNEQAATAIAT
jgi:hypothetical protein